MSSLIVSANFDDKISLRSIINNWKVSVSNVIFYSSRLLQDIQDKRLRNTLYIFQISFFAFIMVFIFSLVLWYKYLI